MDSTFLQPEASYPAEWHRMSFDDFTTLKRGKDLTREHFRTGKVPVAGSNGVIGYHDTANVSAPGVTVGRSGSVGKVSFYEEDFWAHNTALFVADFHGNYPLFVGYFLQHLRLGRFGSGASVPTLDRNVFRTLPVIVPIPAEQRKIASVLGLVQQAIEQQERLIALTTDLKKSLMHKLFTEGLRGERQKQTEIGPVPESWEIDLVGNMASLKSGGTPNRSRPEYWQGGAIPWVKTGEVDYCLIRETEEKITQAGLDNSSAKLFPAGTLLMAMYGQGITRGKVATLAIEAATNQACVAFFPKEGIRSKFLYYFFESKYEVIRNLGHGANQKNLSADLLSTVVLAYPSDPKDQDLIVKMLETVDDKIAVTRKKITHLSDLFRTLLHQLMTAQIRVHDLDLSFLEQEAVGS